MLCVEDASEVFLSEINQNSNEQFVIESKFCEKGQEKCAYYANDFTVLNQVYFELNFL